MSGLLIVGFMAVHLIFWIIQIWINQASGGKDCDNIINLACGSPLQDIAKMVTNFQSVDGIFDVLIFLIQAIGLIITSFIALAFFSYDWLSGGGQIIDLSVMIIRLTMAAVFLGVIGKIAITAIGNRLGG